jgi:hypothetical protein
MKNIQLLFSAGGAAQVAELVVTVSRVGTPTVTARGHVGVTAAVRGRDGARP